VSPLFLKKRFLLMGVISLSGSHNRTLGGNTLKFKGNRDFRIYRGTFWGPGTFLTPIIGGHTNFRGPHFLGDIFTHLGGFLQQHREFGGGTGQAIGLKFLGTEG